MHFPDEQLAEFRKEYLEREKEIQRYIGVYLSGVVIVFSWLIGPQSRPLNEMVLGNDGYNVYAFLMITIVNTLFITFLIYKSLDVHDTTQFIAVYAKPESIYTKWESWRRSDYSITKPVRTWYFFALALLPTVMALLLLSFVASKIFASESSLQSQILRIETSRPVTSPRQPLANPNPADAPSPIATPRDVIDTFTRTQSVFWFAQFVFGLVVLLHALPIMFFYRNAGPTKWQWDTIAKLKESQKAGGPLAPRDALKLERFIEERPALPPTEAKDKSGKAPVKKDN